MEKQKYMNPYLAGVLLGLVLLSAMFFFGAWPWRQRRH